MDDDIEWVEARYNRGPTLLRGFLVSRQGDVRRGMVPVKPYIKPANRQVFIKLRGRSYQLGRLVLMSFGSPRPFKYAVARHRNDDTTDCSLANLYWERQRRATARPKGRFHHIRSRFSVRRGAFVHEVRVGRTRHYGMYTSLEEAIAARDGWLRAMERPMNPIMYQVADLPELGRDSPAE